MVILWLQLIGMLAIILIAALIFTNAIEHFGEKLKISAGVTGSIFAAVSTALPETLIPVLALIAGTQSQNTNELISIGAILGAPLLLSTLAIFLIAITALKQRGLKNKITPEKTGLVRDLNFFLIAFVLATISLYLPLHPVYWRASISIFLVFLYFVYLLLTVHASKKLVTLGHGVILDGPLLFSKFGLKNNIIVIILQLICSLVLLVLGAEGFISRIAIISSTLNISPLILSLLIIPIATELPEKINSILWIRKRKDTLAFGNITGAMVFQGTLLPALAIMLTPWQPNKEILTGIIITLLATIALRINAASQQGLRILPLFLNGALYVIYLYIAF